MMFRLSVPSGWHQLQTLDGKSVPPSPPHDVEIFLFQPPHTYGANCSVREIPIPRSNEVVLDRIPGSEPTPHPAFVSREGSRNNEVRGQRRDVQSTSQSSTYFFDHPCCPLLTPRGSRRLGQSSDSSRHPRDRPIARDPRS